MINQLVAMLLLAAQLYDVGRNEVYSLGDVEKVVADTLYVADSVQKEDRGVGGALAGFQAFQVVGCELAVHQVEIFLKGYRFAGGGAVGVLQGFYDLLELFLQEIVYLDQFPDGGIGNDDLLVGTLLGQLEDVDGKVADALDVVRDVHQFGKKRDLVVI